MQNSNSQSLCHSIFKTGENTDIMVFTKKIGELINRVEKSKAISIR